jgi:hypothetical protein
MADKNLMSAISGLSEAKADPEKTKTAAKKKPKVVTLGKGGTFTVKPNAVPQGKKPPESKK